MLMHIRGGSFLVMTAALLGAGCSSSSSSGQAPDFKLRSLDDHEVSLSSFKGKVVLIDFWAVGCGPCRMEMPHLKSLYEKSGGRLVVLAVNAWDEPPEVVKNFVESEKLPFTVLLNGSKVFESQYHGNGIPMGVLVDSTGRIVFTHLGFDQEGMEQLDAKVKQLLG